MPIEKGIWTRGPEPVIGDQSMGKIKRQFNIQFKTKICEAIRGGLATITEVCREYQLSRTVVDRWLAAFDDGRLTGKLSNRELELERENEKLKAKVGELTMQIDILKKMDEWLRQQRSVASSIITGENLARFQKPAKPQASQSQPTTTKERKTR
jgi:transposase-like protein